MDEILKAKLEINKKRFQIKKANRTFLGRQNIYEKLHKKFRLNDIEFQLEYRINRRNIFTRCVKTLGIHLVQLNV
jgi:hypothetical protein